MDERITGVWISQDGAQLAYSLEFSEAGIYIINTDMITSEGHEITEVDSLDQGWRRIR
jgi:hypothetical protein